MKKIKYLIVIPDGMSDEPVPSLGNKTPMEAAKTPVMDEWASKGKVGWAQNVPEGMPPGSDVANLSIFGFYPRKYYTGRAPLEAARAGIDLGENIVYRCNLVTLQDGLMKDFTAGHITTEEATLYIDLMCEIFKEDPVQFHLGKSYRHLMVAPPEWNDVECTPPHDITDQVFEPNLPKGGCSPKVNDLMTRSRDILQDHPLNQKRIKDGKSPVSSIWLWGQGGKPQLSLYKDRFGIDAAVISAVDLLMGIGRLSGMKVIEVPGATGFVDTNYEGKAHAALKALEEIDMVLIHLESPDESGHMGDAELKTKAIEQVDERVCQILKTELEKGDCPYHVLLLPDHPTPVRIKTHTNEPVPYLIYRSDQILDSGCENFSEKEVQRLTSEPPIPGHLLSDVLYQK